MKEIYVKQGLLATGNTPDQFAAFIRTELVETGKLVKAAGATAE